MKLPEFERFYGVDFSGGRRAGESIWVARLSAAARKRGPRFNLDSLDRLDRLAGTPFRGPCLEHLVRLVRDSDLALWGFDFPFGLPVELFPADHRWDDQFDHLHGWGDEAYACGLEFVRRAKELVGRMHIRRDTDRDAKAPFDTFHYRIIYQTFFGIRDVIGPLRRTPGTAVLPFQYRRLPRARRVLVECCPGSVLKRLGLPHQNYKQPAGGPLTRTRKQTRHTLLDWLAGQVRIRPRDRRAMMRNPGGDALDAVIAAVGAALAVPAADHRAIRRHPRYPREGHLFC